MTSTMPDGHNTCTCNTINDVSNTHSTTLHHQPAEIPPMNTSCSTTTLNDNSTSHMRTTTCERQLNITCERQLNITQRNANRPRRTARDLSATTCHRTPLKRMPTHARCVGRLFFVPDKFHCRPYAPNGQACTPAKLRSLRQRIELIGVPHKLMSPTCVAM